MFIDISSFNFVILQIVKTFTRFGKWFKVTFHTLKCIMINTQKSLKTL